MIDGDSPRAKNSTLFVKQRPSCNSLSLNPISPDVSGTFSPLLSPVAVPSSRCFNYSRRTYSPFIGLTYERCTLSAALKTRPIDPGQVVTTLSARTRCLVISIRRMGNAVSSFNLRPLVFSHDYFSFSKKWQINNWIGQKVIAFFF